MPEIFNIDENICQQILSLKLSPNAIEEELQNRGIQKEHITEYPIWRRYAAKAKQRGVSPAERDKLCQMILLKIKSLTTFSQNTVFNGITCPALWREIRRHTKPKLHICAS